MKSIMALDSALDLMSFVILMESFGIGEKVQGLKFWSIFLCPAKLDKLVLSHEVFKNIPGFPSINWLIISVPNLDIRYQIRLLVQNSNKIL